LAIKDVEFVVLTITGLQM